VFIKRGWPLLEPSKGQSKENVNKNLFMNHWPECIDICHGTSLGQGNFVQLKFLGSYKWPRPKGTLFYIAKTFKNLLLMNHWLKIVSIVELDPQAMLTIRLPILSKNIIHYDVR